MAWVVPLAAVWLEFADIHYPLAGHMQKVSYLAKFMVTSAIWVASLF